MLKVNPLNLFNINIFRILSVFLFILSYARAQSGSPSQWYSASGKKTTYSRVLKDAQKADIVLFGELHNNSICHWYQTVLARDLVTLKNGKLMLGAEMFETHQQAALDSFLQGLYTKDAFIKNTQVWPNYATDYHTLTELAARHKLLYIASNVPRKYAKQVSKYGYTSLDTLPESEKALFCPLPYPVDTSLQCYQTLMSMGHGSNFNPYYFASAQALKDATMAHFILKHFKEGYTFLHLNGAFHSDYFESIVWFLRKAKPELKIMVITTQENTGLQAPDKTERKKADYFLITDPDVPKSY